MPELSDRIFSALDDAVAQEVGERLRQVAKNIPPGSGPPALPANFEDSLRRLKMLHAQVKVLVSRTFAGASIAPSAILSLNALQGAPAIETIEAQGSDEGARPTTGPREATPGLARHSKKRATKKKRQA